MSATFFQMRRRQAAKKAADAVAKANVTNDKGETKNAGEGKQKASKAKPVKE